MMRTHVLLNICLLVCLCSFSPAWGDWTENGSYLCPYYWMTPPVLLSAGQGETIAAWYDSRGIYAQRYDSFGNELWGSGGAAMCTASGLKQHVAIASDGAGGAYITWEDSRSGNVDIYAQRVNKSGVPQWSLSGVAICTATGNQFSPKTIADGAGCAYISWYDGRLGTTNYNIYACRVRASGTLHWTMLVCSATGNQQYPVIVSDDGGGAIVAWYDRRSGGWNDIYAQRVDSLATECWTANGVDICTESHEQTGIQMTADGIGGAIVAWTDDRSTVSWDIYAQRVNHSSTRLWTTNGVAVCNAAEEQSVPVLVSDKAEGAIIAWRDMRLASTWSIYAQRMSGTGTALWTANGISLCSTYGSSPAIVPDGIGGAIVSWSDGRNGSDINIYAQRLNPSGTAYWQACGVPVCTTPGEQESSIIVSDGSGGGVIAWRDYRSGSEYYYYIERVERNGYWGYPCPEIHAVRDVPGDQGGYLNLAWNASRLDPWPNQLITYYSLWKAINPTQAALLLGRGGKLLASPGDVSREFEGPAIRMEQVADQTYYWELVATQNANYYETYAKKLATDFDSTAVCTEQHYFQVCAHTADPKACWTSPPDSGYSVDNLPPCTPLSLAGEQSFVPEGLTLSWDRNTEFDFGTYAVYRGLDENFEPSLENRIASACDTFLFDNEWRWDSGYWYKVSAVDVHGNESGYAVLAPEAVTGTGSPGAPAATYLSQNSPNPFNPLTRIEFGIKEPAHVSLRIYDAAGRLVRVLVESDRPAGRYVETWDGTDAAGQAASGIYFYRLTAARFEQTKKMVLLK